MSQIDKLIADLCPDGVSHYQLGEIAGYSDTRAQASHLDKTTFVGVDNLLPNKGGRVDANHAPNTSSLTAYETGDLLLGNIRPYLKKIWLSDRTGGCSGDVLAVRLSKAFHPLVNARFLYYTLSSDRFFSYAMQHSKGAKMPRGDKAAILNFRIPVPPLEVQREIVRVLDKFTQLEAELEAELEARRRQYEHYKIRLLTFDPKADWCTLGEIADYVNGKAQERFTSPQGDIPLVTARFVSRNGEANRFIHHDDILTPALAGDTALVLSDLPNGRALARTFFVDKDNRYAINQRVARIRTKDQSRVNPRFIYRYLDRNPSLLMHDNGVDQTHLSKAQVTQLRFPLPPLEEQRRVVSILDKFDSLVNDLSIGLPAELAARRKQYEYYRDRLLTFEEKR